MEPINPFVNENDGKTAGLVSYFFIIGWLISYFALYQNNKTSLASYQLRQTLLFHIVSMVLGYGGSIIFGMIFLSTGIFSLFYLLRLIELALFVLWIIGFIGAINGDKKPIPLIGEPAQKMFSSL